ncbi:MAG: hypothetical protein Q9160_001764 [Pyrenula sp. 1 TL-2023]
MTIRPKSKVKFTPELLISAPRPSSAVPNDDGSLALFTTSSYSTDADTESNETKILDLKTGHTSLFSNDSAVKEPQWLVGNSLLWLKPVSGGKTQIWIGTVGLEKNEYLVGTIDSSISRVKTKVLADETVIFAFTALKAPDGRLFNPESATKPASTAREYESSMPRYWDTWLSDEPPVDVLAGTRLHFPWTTTSPLGDGGSYDVSSEGLIFDTLNLENFDPTHKAITDIWYHPFSSRHVMAGKAVKRIVVPGWDGSASGGVFSPDGKSVAFLKDKKFNPAYTRPSIFVVELKETNVSGYDQFVLSARAVSDSWDRSPVALYWANEARELLIVAEEHGRVKLFKVPLVGSSQQKPIPLSDAGSISAVHPLCKTDGRNQFLVTFTSIIDSAIYTIIDSRTASQTLVSTFTSHGAKFGLSPDQVKEFHFPSARGDYEVQSWLVLPSTFQASKRYPVAYLIHGGPISSWPDSWSTRWNAAIFAEQGYVVAMPNITGSTGFGRHHAEAVIGDWSGRPYRDIEACVSYIESTYEFIDPGRFVALGASYGGYMMNWLQGQPLAKRFRAIVCHDGIFSIPSFIGTDSTGDLALSFNGALWENPATWDAMDPARFTHNWTQPMLVIHSDRDYRCPINSGLASYNVCKLRGIPARLLNFPEENHLVLGRANSLHWHRTVLGWINKWAHNEGNGNVELQGPVSDR